MRTVLHFFPRFFPFSWGGAENYIRGFINYQKRSGANVYLLCTVPDNYDTGGDIKEIVDFNYHFGFRYIFEGIDVICIKPKIFNMFDYALYDRVKQQKEEYTEDWIRIFRYFIPSVVTHLHIHSSERSFLYPHYIQALKNSSPVIKIYSHCHDSIPCIKNTLVTSEELPCSKKAGTLRCITCSTTLKELPKSHHVFRYMLSKFSQAAAFSGVIAEHDRLTDVWVTYTNHMRDNLLRNKFKKRVISLEHGINPVFLTNRVPARTTGNITRFAFAGRFVESKGLIILLEAWAQLPDREDRQLYLLGNEDGHTGERISKLLQKVKKRNDIFYLGKKEPSEVAEILDSIHCVIIPSLYQEIGPLILHESLARGCNIIASALGGMKEYAVRNKSNSISLFKHNDREMLKRLIQNFQYKSLHQALNPVSEEAHFENLEKLLLTGPAAADL